MNDRNWELKPKELLVILNGVVINSIMCMGNAVGLKLQRI